MRDSDWCVPVKHVAKLSRMRGSTSTKTNINFFVDPEREDRDNDTTPDCLRSMQFAQEDNVSYKCNCCEAGGTQWKRTRNLSTKKSSVRFSSLTDADINFFEKGNKDLCDLQQNTWAPLSKPLVVDSGAGETVMPVDWLTSHPLTESDGSRANDFHTTADAAKCTTKDKENWMFAHSTDISEDRAPVRIKSDQEPAIVDVQRAETRGKIKDDIEEFGYGGAPVRIKSDQEPAIVDVQRAVMIAKRGKAPTKLVNSPAGDSQSNGRVENAIKKVRIMVETILSSLESRWCVRVARDHPSLSLGV